MFRKLDSVYGSLRLGSGEIGRLIIWIDKVKDMGYFWSLKIRCNDSLRDTITVILGVESNVKESVWELEKIIEEEDAYVNYTKYFLDLLEGNYERLSLIKVERCDISIWLLYEYDQQCNMEFSPDNLKRMGENGIVLCVSCWQKG